MVEILGVNNNIALTQFRETDKSILPYLDFTLSEWMRHRKNIMHSISAIAFVICAVM